jgi:methyltransferase (TIGR00027 family)
MNQREICIASLKRCALLLFLLFCLRQAAWPVEEGKPSWTAENVASFRAIAALDPDEKVKNPDYMAARFISREYWSTVPGLSLDFASSRKTIAEWRVSGYFYINARTKYIDSLLEEAIGKGARQVVVMGAGYDSRAYRFHSKYPDVTFFEVDLPDTQKRKQRLVAEILGQAPVWVHYAPIDFNTQTLIDVLSKAGYSKDLKTFFIWEGVTMYVDAAGVDDTLKFIAEGSAPGSTLVFDYVLKPVIGGDYRFYGSRTTTVLVAEHGEPFVFGIDEGDSGNYLARRGLAIKSDLGHRELTERYLVRSDGSVDGRMHEFLRIVVAEIVPEKERAALKEKAGPEPAGKSPARSEASEVPVPPDIREFLDNYAADLAKHDMQKIMSHYSNRYVLDGRGRDETKRFWEFNSTRAPYRDLREARFFITSYEPRGDIAEINGYVKSNTGIDPLGADPDEPLLIIKEDGSWRWYGNQKGSLRW